MCFPEECPNTGQGGAVLWAPSGAASLLPPRGQRPRARGWPWAAPWPRRLGERSVCRGVCRPRGVLPREDWGPGPTATPSQRHCPRGGGCGGGARGSRASLSPSGSRGVSLNSTAQAGGSRRGAQPRAQHWQTRPGTPPAPPDPVSRVHEPMDPLASASRGPARPGPDPPAPPLATGSGTARGGPWGQRDDRSPGEPGGQRTCPGCGALAGRTWAAPVRGRDAGTAGNRSRWRTATWASAGAPRAGDPAAEDS